MTRRWTVFSEKCPSRSSLARIANKWTAMIVILLHAQPLRFSELHRAIEGISKKVLIDTLKALERDGMLQKHVVPEGHARYELTELGRTLHAPLESLQLWAQEHVDDVLSARDRFDASHDDKTLKDDAR